MTESRSGTRLPEERAYWEGLAARCVDAAFTASAPRARPALAIRPPWWRMLSDAAWVLAAAAVVALIGGARLLDAPLQSTAVATHALDGPATHAFAGALGPDEPLLAAVLGAAEPPPASALLALIALRSDR